MTVYDPESILNNNSLFTFPNSATPDIQCLVSAIEELTETVKNQKQIIWEVAGDVNNFHGPVINIEGNKLSEEVSKESWFTGHINRLATFLITIILIIIALIVKGYFME